MKILDIQFVLDKYNVYQQKHADYTACLCYAMGQAILCNPKELEQLYFSGLLLQSGQLVLSGILGLPNKNNDTNYIVYSTNFVNTLQGFSSVAKILSQVEENVDGTGVPNHLHGIEIDTLSKVVRISSFYAKCRLNGISHELTCKKIRSYSDKIFPKKIITHFIKTVIANKLHLDHYEIEES